MKLPDDVIISQLKLRKYLLSLRRRNDKSRWLAQAGYHDGNWQILEKDIRELIAMHEAVPVEKNEYGQLYQINGRLTGPNGTTLPVCTVWMHESETSAIKFITMFPFKGRT